MTSMSHPQLRKIQNEFRSQWRDNLRFRLAIHAIVALLLVYGMLLLGDWQKASAEAEQRELRQLERLQILAGETEWPVRAQQAMDAVKAVESLFWRAENRGLAQAMVQDSLERLAREAGIEQLSVRAEQPQVSDGNPDVMQVSAALEGGFNADSWTRLMTSLSRHPQVIHVERLGVVNEGQRPRFNMIVRLPFLMAMSEPSIARKESSP